MGCTVVHRQKRVKCFSIWFLISFVRYAMKITVGVGC
ncbi:hypothetical protein NC652_014413 [Populus alba x Populus x berolinensis]|nr:hypothetical protein NC652_014413 [Populus alba x Populus x berolinensis]